MARTVIESDLVDSLVDLARNLTGTTDFKTEAKKSSFDGREYWIIKQLQ